MRLLTHFYLRVDFLPMSLMTMTTLKRKRGSILSRTSEAFSKLSGRQWYTIQTYYVATLYVTRSPCQLSPPSNPPYLLTLSARHLTPPYQPTNSLPLCLPTRTHCGCFRIGSVRVLRGSGVGRRSPELCSAHLGGTHLHRAVGDVALESGGAVASDDNSIDSWRRSSQVDHGWTTRLTYPLTLEPCPHSHNTLTPS